MVFNRIKQHIAKKKQDKIFSNMVASRVSRTAVFECEKCHKKNDLLLFYTRIEGKDALGHNGISYCKKCKAVYIKIDDSKYIILWKNWKKQLEKEAKKINHTHIDISGYKETNMRNGDLDKLDKCEKCKVKLSNYECPYCKNQTFLMHT